MSNSCINIIDITAEGIAAWTNMTLLSNPSIANSLSTRRARISIVMIIMSAAKAIAANSLRLISLLAMEAKIKQGAEI